MNLKAKLYVLLVIGVVILFTWLVIRDTKSKSYIYSDFGVDLPDGDRSLGIDVSHYQGDINWPEVTAMNIDGDSLDFVFIKCTEGTTLKDDRCAENAEGACDAGLLFGFYHFFIPEVSAVDQARIFAEQCDQYADSLRPVLDIEVRNKYSHERIVDSVFSFLEAFEKITSVRPMIYTNESFFEDYFSQSYLKNEKFWIANYNGECKAWSLENVYIWQFSETATVNGIGEKVDLNVAKPEFRQQIYLFQQNP